MTIACAQARLHKNSHTQALSLAVCTHTRTHVRTDTLTTSALKRLHIHTPNILTNKYILLIHTITYTCVVTQYSHYTTARIII